MPYAQRLLEHVEQHLIWKCVETVSYRDGTIMRQEGVMERILIEKLHTSTRRETGHLQ